MDSRQRLLIIAVLSLALLAAGVYWLAIPGYRQYQGMKDQSEQLQAKVAQARITANSLRSEMIQYNQTKVDLDRLSNLFENEMRDGSSVILLGLRSTTTQVDITSIIPGDIVEQPNYLEMPLTITAEGNYLNMVAFCSDIEMLPNLTDVRMIEITSLLGSNGSSNVKVSIGMIIFSAKTPQEKLNLEEISRWAIGRSNVFQPPDSTLQSPGAWSSLSQNLATPIQTIRIGTEIRKTRSQNIKRMPRIKKRRKSRSAQRASSAKNTGTPVR